MFLKFSALVLLLGYCTAQIHIGDGTYSEISTNSCGVDIKAGELVVGVSPDFFDGFPGAGKNPNKNPICKKHITATYKDKSVTAAIVDKCVGCDEYDLNFSPEAFSKLASRTEGRLHGVAWRVVGGEEM